MNDTSRGAAIITVSVVYEGSAPFDVCVPSGSDVQDVWVVARNRLRLPFSYDVWINGRSARAVTEVHSGDRVEFRDTP